MKSTQSQLAHLRELGLWRFLRHVVRQHLRVVEGILQHDRVADANILDGDPFPVDEGVVYCHQDL